MELQRPLVYLDIEATGADTTRDRIVEIALIRKNPDGTQQERVERVNPGLRIPIEVVAVHGITNEAVAHCPNFREIAPSLLDFMQDCDFAGFGIQRFDMPLLTEEFRRCGLPFSTDGRCVIDALIIFHQNEPRDLTAAYKFYCGKELKGAHGAKADTIAALEVIDAQMKRYSDLPQTAQALHDYCRRQQDERFVDPGRKFFWKDGEAAFNFGKHKGELLRDLVKAQRDYIEWLINDGKFPQDVIDICWKALRGEFPRRTSS
jgi:DNA polymerase-3 subunit epsilon